MKSATRGSSSTRSTFTQPSPRLGRKCDSDGRPFAQPARHLDPSFMRLDDCLGHGKTEPKPLVVHRGGIPTAAETLENTIELLGRDADAPIGDAHGDLAIDAADVDFHCSFGLGVAHGIVKQHQEQLPEFAGSPRTISCSSALAKAMSTAWRGRSHARRRTLFRRDCRGRRLRLRRAAPAPWRAMNRRSLTSSEVLRLLDDPLDRALLGDPPLAPRNEISLRRE